MEHKLYESFMQVEPVLRYLKKVNNPLTTQYTLIQNGKAINANFFKCTDLKNTIGERQFRMMECEVTQHLVKVTKIENENVTLAN